MEYNKDSSVLFENMKTKLVNNINQCRRDDKKLHTGTFIYQDFPWDSKSEMSTYLKSVAKKGLKTLKMSFSDLEVYNESEKQDSCRLIAEATFGSYWNEIECIEASGYISSTQLNKIDLRRQSALKIINSQTFSRKQDSKYWKIIISQITEELLKASINHLSERVAGWQRGWSLSEEEIYEKPFEAIKQLSSTRGRLIVLRNWDRIIRHPNFMLQSCLKELYGLSIFKSRSELSKL